MIQAALVACWHARALHEIRGTVKATDESGPLDGTWPLKPLTTETSAQEVELAFSANHADRSDFTRSFTCPRSFVIHRDADNSFNPLPILRT